MKYQYVNANIKSIEEAILRLVAGEVFYWLGGKIYFNPKEVKSKLEIPNPKIKGFSPFRLTLFDEESASENLNYLWQYFDVWTIRVEDI